MTRNEEEAACFFSRYDSNTHQAVSQQASIFGTRNPSGEALACARRCVVIFGSTAPHVTSGYVNKK